MQQPSVPMNDTTGVVTYSNGSETLRIFMGKAPPMDEKKLEAADTFGTVDLPRIVELMLLFQSGNLDSEIARRFLADLRSLRSAVNAFEKVGRVSGHGFVEAYNGAIEGIQAARFGDRRYENKVAEFLSLIDRLFPAIYEKAEEAALATLDNKTAKK